MRDRRWRRVAGFRVVVSWPEAGYAAPPVLLGGLRARFAGMAGVLLILAGLGTELFASVEDALAVVLELAPQVRPDPAATAQYSALRTGWEQVRGQVFPAFTAC